MPDTRPGELSTLEARKIAEQIVDKMETETDFKIEVLLKLERLIVEVAHLKTAVEEDRKKIGAITQTIDDNKGVLNKIIGGLVLIAAGGGLIAGIAKLIESLRGGT